MSERTVENKLIELLTSDIPKEDFLKYYGAAYRLAKYMIDNGVTIPVRCKKCEFFKDTWTSDDGRVYGYCPHMAVEHSENGYCNFGKGKE